MLFYRQGTLLSKIDKIIAINSEKSDLTRQFISQYYEINLKPDFIITNEIIETDNLKLIIPKKGLNKKIPSIKANLFLSQLAWIAEKLRSSITGKKPLITKETARTAFHKYSYSNEKIRKILNFEFVPMPQSISDTCKLFLKDISAR